MPSMAIRWNEWIDCKPKWREYRASSTNSLETEHQLHARAIRGMPARTNCPFPSEHLIASLPAREASNPREGLWSDIEQKKCDGCFASAGCASNISLPSRLLRRASVRERECHYV